MIYLKTADNFVTPVGRDLNWKLTVYQSVKLFSYNEAKC
jgi:hypothetical protein